MIQDCFEFFAVVSKLEKILCYSNISIQKFFRFILFFHIGLCVQPYISELRGKFGGALLLPLFYIQGGQFIPRYKNPYYYSYYRVFLIYKLPFKYLGIPILSRPTHRPMMCFFFRNFEGMKFFFSTHF